MVVLKGLDGILGEQGKQGKEGLKVSLKSVGKNLVNNAFVNV